ncbi:MAG: hypothetical protein CMH53_01065 [Myxococcales bacterium]|nr:hypothetical protein [Myxococcales bacterium]
MITNKSLKTLVTSLILLLLLGGCDSIRTTIDKVRLKTIGITVTEPDTETAEWVLMNAIEAARDKNEAAGWQKFQHMLHSSERSVAALRGWYTGAWPRMRKQIDHYDINGDGSFKIVDVREMTRSAGGIAGYEYYIVSKKKEMPTPCAVYKDEENGEKWRIRRCSL